MNSRKDLLYRLQAADFAVYDLMLYLDTHPCCQSTLTLYHEKLREACLLRKEYEEKYGPLTVKSVSDRVPWQWIENPWVWERSN